MIQVKNLYKEYCNDEVVTKVLDDLSFKIEKQEFVAIQGPSGSGKSTLMHILGFLDRASRGEYFFEGEDTSKFDDEKRAKIRNEKIGFVFQQFNLLPRTSVLENIKLPLTYSKKVSQKEKDKLALAAINSVGLSHRINNLSNQLSGGETQRVAIARALVLGPAIIFADEPTGNLDTASGKQIMDILSELNHQGKTVIVVTHEALIAQYAKRMIKLKDGRIIEDEIKN